jgi:hypothetical protein
MSDPLERVLKLVAEGRLTADEAAPILDALSARETNDRDRGGPKAAAGPAEESDPQLAAAPPGSGPRIARIQVMEGGRRVVDLRIPTSLGKFALGRVPGLSGEHIGELQRAISSGLVGPLLDVEDEDGDGVRIVLE